MDVARPGRQNADLNSVADRRGALMERAPELHDRVVEVGGRPRNGRCANHGGRSSGATSAEGLRKALAAIGREPREEPEQ